MNIPKQNENESALEYQIRIMTLAIGEAERQGLPCVSGALDLPGIGRRYVEIRTLPGVSSELN